jgi:hypothetical protein
MLPVFDGVAALPPCIVFATVLPRPSGKVVDVVVEFRVLGRFCYPSIHSFNYKRQGSICREALRERKNLEPTVLGLVILGRSEALSADVVCLKSG